MAFTPFNVPEPSEDVWPELDLEPTHPLRPSVAAEVDARLEAHLGAESPLAHALARTAHGLLWMTRLLFLTWLAGAAALVYTALR